MNKKSETLYRLIKSLTQRQKNNFLRFVGGVDKDEDYLQLYREISNSGQDSDIENSFQQFKNLSATKSYLFEKILESLSYYDPGESLNLAEIYDSALVLIDFQLHEVALNLVQKGSVIAIEIEDMAMAITFLEKEYSICEFLFLYNEFYEKSKIVLEKKRRALSAIHRQDELLNLYRETKHLLKMRHDSPVQNYIEIIESVKQHPVFQDSTLTLSQKDQIMKSLIEINCKELQFDRSGQIEIGMMAITIFENKLVLKREWIERYLEIGLRVMNACQIELQPEKAEKIFQLLKKEVLSGKIPGIGFVEKYLLIFFGYLNNSGQIDEAEIILHTIEETWSEDYSKFSKEWNFLFHYSTAKYYFDLGEPSKALVWINKFFTIPKSEKLPQVQGFARVLELYVYYEMGEYEVIENKIRATKNFFQSRGILDRYEIFIIEIISKVMKYDNAIDRNLFFTDKFNEANALLSNKEVKLRNEFFYIESWLEKWVTITSQ